MTDLREKVARAMAYSVRQPNDCALNADDYWQNTGSSGQHAWLVAAGAALAVIGPASVKPLEWEDQGDGSYVWTLGLHYYAEADRDDTGVTWYAACMIGNDDVWSETGFPSLEAAKDAAQADHAARILALIDGDKP